MTTTTELRVMPRPDRAHTARPRTVPSWLRGRVDDPGWVRPALLTLLLGTALVYLWDLGSSENANEFYAAAVQAGTQSAKAWLFGSLDSSNFITVDKPPAALWVMALSGRIFGFSSWSMLAPEALMGVGSVGLLYLAVRRWAGPAAGLVAGAALALTPVAVLMFRFNNPDALLVLTLVAAAYAVVRAIDAGRRGTWWMAGAGALIGLGFLTKMLQAFLVLPALGAVFLLAAAVPWRRRLAQLGVAVTSLLASVSWYVLLVDLWPADSRPYIGGSTNNTLLNLVLGYNGLGRILGGEGNGGGPGGGSGGGGNTGFGGSTGIGRMFGSAFGTQVSWLLPAALLVFVAGLWLTRRAPRTDRSRAALLLWGGWMLVTGLVFSFMSGTIHPYYSVALAPGVAGTLAVGVRMLWTRRTHIGARLTLAAAVAMTAGWSVVLLRRTPEFLPWLRWVVAVAGVVAVIGLLAHGVMRGRWWRRVVPALVLATLLAGAGASTAYAVETAGTAHTGSIVSAGPAASDSGPGGHGGPAGSGGHGGPGGGPGDQGGAGGTTSTELTSLLASAGTRWSAATVSAQGASSLELSSGTAVMAIGGFTGSDAAPSLEQFQAWVAAGDVHWFVATQGGAGGGPGGGGPGGGGPGDQGGVSSQITSWVAEHYTATTVGGSTVYDLTQPTR